MPNSDFSRRTLIYGLPVLAVLLYVALKQPRDAPAPAPLPAADDAAQHTAPATQEAVAVQAAPAPHDARLQRHADGSVDYLPALAISRQLGQARTAKGDLQAVAHLLSHYRFAYRENPVGVDNFEITEQLLGANPMRIRFIAPDCPALRGNELVDRWNTPYRFHAVSGQQMEIRSAGADTNFWTEDDIKYSGD